MDMRAGFTLVEIVVVILILGILAAIVAPKLADTGGTATDNGLRRTLSVIRRAIERYKAENGDFPGASDGTETTFKSDLAPYLRGPFPASPVGPKKGTNRVRMRYNTAPLSGNSSPGRAWKFDYVNGDFINNFDGLSTDGVTPYDDF